MTDITNGIALYLILVMSVLKKKKKDEQSQWDILVEVRINNQNSDYCEKVDNMSNV